MGVHVGTLVGVHMGVACRGVRYSGLLQNLLPAMLYYQAAF